MRQRAVGARPEVGDHRDLDARRGEFERGAIGRIVRRRDDDARARLDAVARDQRPRRLGEHDPRPVVVGEDQRTLERAGRQHDALGAHLPQPLARLPRIGRGEMVGQPLLARR